MWTVTAENADRAIEQRHRDENAEVAQRAEREAADRASQVAAEAHAETERRATQEAAPLIV